jgi:hypothetical protein
MEQRLRTFEGTRIVNRDPEPGYCNKGQISFFMVQEQWAVTKDRDLNQGSGTKDRDSEP